MKKYLFFDLDDTLIITQPEYDKVKDKVLKLVKSLINSKELTTDVVENLIKVIDNNNVKIHGLSKKRFPDSWVKTYISLCEAYEKEVNEKDVELVKNTAEEIFHSNIPTYKETHEVLTNIKKLNHSMSILTAGDIEVQNKRIKDANLESYFDNIFIVPNKTPEVMNSLILRKNQNNCIMIGNSLRSDIHPALSNNMKAIHIIRDTWEYDHYNIDKSNPNYKVIQELSEIPAIIESL